MSGSGTGTSRWRHGFWALADQGGVSLGSFVTMIILTRGLAPTEFGLYTLLYSALLFLNSIHGALIIYPVLVRAAAVAGLEARRIYAGSIWLTLLLNVVLAICLVGVLWTLCTLPVIAWALLLMLLWQFQETFRRIFMARLQHGRAIPGDIIAYAAAPAVYWLLSRHGALTLMTVLMGGCGSFGLGALVHAAQLSFARCDVAAVRRQARDNWIAGRWMLLTNLVNIGNIQILPWGLAYWHGLAAAAAMRAVVSPGTITHPIMFSLGNVIVPSVARLRAEGNASKANWSAIVQGLQFAILLGPYFLVLILFPTQVLSGLYGAQSPYLVYAPELRLVAAFFTAMLMAQVLESLLKGLERTRAVFLAQFSAIGATLCLGMPLTYEFGMTGALWGYFLAMLALFLWYVWTLYVQRPDASGSPRRRGGGFPFTGRPRAVLIGAMGSRAVGAGEIVPSEERR